MISKASAVFVRISPRKVRYVIDMIRSKPVLQAQAILNGSPRRGRDIVRKILDQAVDAALRNSQVSAKDLVISKVLADGGPSMKRFRAATMGRANRIRKRTSHIQLELDLAKGRLAPSKGPVKEAKAKSAPVAAPEKKEKKLFNLKKKTVGAK